jgi:hypothetical protein
VSTTPIVAAMRALPSGSAPNWEHPDELDLVLMNVATTERPGGGGATCGAGRLIGGGTPEPTWAWYGRGIERPAARELLGEIAHDIPVLPLDGGNGSYLEEAVYPLTYKPPRAGFGAWDVTVFLSSIARTITTVRSARYGERFNLGLWSYTTDDGQLAPSGYRPQVKIAGTPPRVFYGTRRDADSTDYTYRDGKRYPWTGRFGSVGALATALSGEPNMTFGLACELWSVERRGGLLGELDALCELYRRLRTDLHGVWGLQVPSDRISTSGGIATDYARRGLPRPPSHRPGPTRTANAMSLAAGGGGRAEARLRLVDVPVVLADGISHHQVSGHLTGASSFPQSERVRCRLLRPGHGLEGFVRFLKELTPEALLDPSTWPHLAGVAMVEPNGSRGVVRGAGVEDEDTTRTTIIESGTHPIPMMLPDVADAVLHGKPPKIVSAYVFSPEGVPAGAHRVKLPGGITWDPKLDVPHRRNVFRDLPTALAEVALRSKAGTLKVEPGSPEAFTSAAKVARNAGGYGLPGNVNPSGRAHRAWGPYGPLEATIGEEPGFMFDPGVYALVASGARLLLGLLERLIADAGGEFAFCDTDALAIVATLEGGDFSVTGAGADGSPIEQTVHAFSYAQVVENLNRLGALAGSTGLSIPAYRMRPEDQGFRLVPCRRSDADLFSVFKITSDNLDTQGVWSPGTRALVVGTKRYGLFRVEDGQVASAKASGHVLATLENFRTGGLADWDLVGAAWEKHIAQHVGAEVRPLPEVLDLASPVLQTLVPSTPRDWRALGELVFGPDNPGGFRPFEALLVPIPFVADHPQLVAPWTSDRAAWGTLIFHDPAGEPYRLTTIAEIDHRGFPHSLDGVHQAIVYDLDTWLDHYFTRPEGCALGPDGAPCSELTRGRLTPEPVRIVGVRFTGAEPVRHAAVEAVVGWKLQQDQVEIGRACQVPGCPRPLPKKAKRWCAVHARWPWRQKERFLARSIERTCEAPGCGRVLEARSRIDRRFCGKTCAKRVERAA